MTERPFQVLYISQENLVTLSRFCLNAKAIKEFNTNFYTYSEDQEEDGKGTHLRTDERQLLQ